MSSEKTQGIVIRLIEFSESSYVATLFTEDFGKITGLAKGARRQKSAFENALDLLAVSRVVFLRKTSEGMDLWTEAKLERRFRAAFRDLRRLYAGYYVAELLQAMTDERDPHPTLFRNALKTIERLDGDGPVALEVLRFELMILRELGHAPTLHHCVECGRELEKLPRVAFGQLAGGVLCSRCKMGQRHVVSLSARAVERMRELLEDEEYGGERDARPAHESESVAPENGEPSNLVASPLPARPQAIDGTGADKAVLGELRGLMNHVISHRIGRRPRMYSFLANSRGSFAQVR